MGRFIAWLKTLLPRPKTPPVVMILSAVPPLTKEDEGSISTLQFHPGFRALVDKKLAAAKGVLRARLEQTRHSQLRDVDFIQSGLFWLSYLEREVAEATRATARTTNRAAEPDELALFQKLSTLIEGVGTTTPESDSHKEMYENE
jgi:hypothetical protein